MSGCSSSDVPVVYPARQQWPCHLVALASVAALIVALFWSDVRNAVHFWWSSATYSHCFLILPISAWLVWEMRDTLALERPALEPFALLVLLPLLFVWLAANFATINEVRQFAVIAIVQIAIVTLLGPRIYRVVLFPALYLFFLVPFGDYLILPMQSFATWFTDAGLSLLGVPHYTEGTTIELTNGRFEIEEACAGLRFLIATFALGVLFAHIAYRSWAKRALFLVACIVVPLIGNGLRCLGTLELAHLTNNELATGADHLVYGWFLNTAILLVLMFIGLRFRDIENLQVSGSIPPAGETAFSRRAVWLTTFATATSLALGPALADWHNNRTVVVDPRAVTRTFALDGWTENPKGPWRPIYIGADAQLMTSFTPGASKNGAPIDVAVAYYARNRAGRSLATLANSLWDPAIWHQVEMRSQKARLGSNFVRLNEAIIASGSQQRLVWWTYRMDGRFTTSRIVIKLLQLKTAFIGDDTAALIAFSVPIDGALADAQEYLETGLANLMLRPRTPVAALQAGIHR